MTVGAQAEMVWTIVVVNVEVVRSWVDVLVVFA